MHSCTRARSPCTEAHGSRSDLDSPSYHLQTHTRTQTQTDRETDKHRRMQRCRGYRSEIMLKRELSNVFSLAKVGFDRTQNEPCKSCPIEQGGGQERVDAAGDLVVDLAEVRHDLRKARWEGKKRSQIERRAIPNLFNLFLPIFANIICFCFFSIFLFRPPNFSRFRKII